MKLRFIIVFISIITISLSAQERENYKTSAISFSINGFSLGGYYGGVGGRLWISNLMTLNVSVNGGSEDETQKSLTSETQQTNTNSFVNLGVGIEKHFAESDNISPYLSGRLFYGWNERIRDIENNSGYKENRSYNSMGVDLGFGVEYWILERISLSGQHLFNFTSSSSESGQSFLYFDDTKYDMSSNSFNFGTTSLMISVYF